MNQRFYDKLFWLVVFPLMVVFVLFFVATSQAQEATPIPEPINCPYGDRIGYTAEIVGLGLIPNMYGTILEVTPECLYTILIGEEEYIFSREDVLSTFAMVVYAPWCSITPGVYKMTFLGEIELIRAIPIHNGDCWVEATNGVRYNIETFITMVNAPIREASYIHAEYYSLDELYTNWEIVFEERVNQVEIIGFGVLGFDSGLPKLCMIPVGCTGEFQSVLLVDVKDGIYYVGGISPTDLVQVFTEHIGSELTVIYP